MLQWAGDGCGETQGTKGRELKAGGERRVVRIG